VEETSETGDGAIAAGCSYGQLDGQLGQKRRSLDGYDQRIVCPSFVTNGADVTEKELKIGSRNAEKKFGRSVTRV
jgi:hypothetical protein